MPEQLTDEKLQEIRARAEKATPGPWEYRPNTGEVAPRIVEGRTGYDGWYDPPDEEDGAFIAHARTDIPALLDELEALRAHLRAAGITRPEHLSYLLKACGRVENEGCAVSDSHHDMLVDAIEACTGEDQ